MIEALLSALMVAMTVATFFHIDALLGVNRVFLGLYKGLFEEAVYVYDQFGRTLSVPYFEVPELRTSLDHYFAVNLPRYAQEYSYDLLILQTTNTTMGPKPIRLRLNLHCLIGLSRAIEKTAVFAIERS